jgi:hypothetical protein
MLIIIYFNCLCFSLNYEIMVLKKYKNTTSPPSAVFFILVHTTILYLLFARMYRLVYRIEVLRTYNLLLKV